MYVCLSVYVYVCMSVCICVCMSVYVYMYVGMVGMVVLFAFCDFGLTVATSCFFYNSYRHRYIVCFQL